MLETPFSSEQYHLDWLRVWQSPWLEMHQSWQACIPDMWRQEDNWRRASPSVIRSFLSIENEPPPEPGEALKHWLTMTYEQREKALIMAAEIVIRGLGEGRLTSEDIIWGRHIAKALLPGKWPLEDWKKRQTEDIGLLLLRQWVSPITWQRMRLFYRKAIFDSIALEPFVEIPSQRLNPLWHAVMWRLSMGKTQNTEEAV